MKVCISTPSAYPGSQKKAKQFLILGMVRGLADGYDGFVALVRGRVISVRRLPDGSYGILVGPGPDVYWIVSSRSISLGQRLEIRADSVVTKPATRQGTPGTVTVVDGGDVRLLAEPFHRRAVAPQWLQRCQLVMKRKLFDYQLEGAAWLAERLSKGVGAIMGDSAGLGKTTQVVAALCAARTIPVLVCCPASLKHHWAREFQYARYNLDVRVVRGSKRALPKAHVLVLNYDLLSYRFPELYDLKSRAILFDEGHALKEPMPSPEHRAMLATRLAHKIGPAVILTGSPVLNRPEELWRLLNIVSPHDWPSFTEYHERYCVVNEEDDLADAIVTSRSAANNVEELRMRVAPVMLRRLKSDVLKDLPEKSRRSVLVDVPEPERTAYEEAARDVVEWLRKLSGDRAAMAAQRNRAMVRLTHLRHLAARGKLREAIPEYLGGWFGRGDPRPLVVFAYHRDIIAGVHEICRHLGVRRTGITGDMPDYRRYAAQQAFQAGEADVFIAPVRSAGVGLNLQRASDVLMLERDWTPSLMAQAEDRCHRIGSNKPVTITYLDAANTIDQHLAYILDDKRRIIDAIVDGKQEEGEHEQLRTLDEVIDLMIGPPQKKS